MDITQLIFNVAVLFIMMIPGLILKKTHMVADTFGKGLSNLVLYIAQPVLIVCAYLDCSLSFSDIWKNIVWVLILSIVAHLVFTVVALIAFYKVRSDEKTKMLRMVTIFSNAAFMGIPLIEVICGPEAVIYASIYNITFNLFLWTMGVYLCTRGIEGTDHNGDGRVGHRDELVGLHKTAQKEISVKKVLLHPVVLAGFLGLICLVFNFNRHTVEMGFIWDSMVMIKSLVAPLSMVVIGLRLADIQWQGAFRERSTYLFLALRHFLLPIMVMLFMKLLVWFGIPLSILVQDVILILAATPAASSATMLAEKYDCDAAYTSRLVLLSTLLCIVSMPLVISLAHLF